MKHARSLFLLLASLALAAACDRAPKPAANGDAAELSRPVAEGKSLLEQGQLDAALQRLQTLPDDPDSLYYQAVVYIKKAEVQPVPEAGFRPDELQALGLLEKAIAAKADHAPAHRVLADLLAPHSLMQHGPGRKPTPRASSPDPAETVSPPDVTPERVVAEYKAAIAADQTGLDNVEVLIRFARAMLRMDDAEFGFRERIRRQAESAEPHVVFGDFLAQDRREPIRALEQYNLALVWEPDNVDVKNRIADIYLGFAEEHFARREYLAAESRLAEAQKFVTDPQTYQAARIREIQGKLRGLRR